MPSESSLPLRTRLAERLAGPVHRRWLRWRSFARPLPQDWWQDFERDFRSYCGGGAPRPGRTEPDH